MSSELYQQFTSVIVIFIAVAYFGVAWLSWKVFFYYGAHSAAKWIVAGFVQVASSWGLVNGGAQFFLPIGSDLRRILIMLSLLGILSGATCELIGLWKIFSGGIRRRG